MSKDLFKKAKEAKPAKKEAKEEKTRIEIKDESFFEKIEKLESLQDKMKKDKDEADKISDELRTLGKNEWVKLYEETGKSPGTVILEQINDSDDTAKLMFIVSDKYISVNEEKAELLREEFGDKIVEEKTTFSFDPEMIEKYGEVISKLIEESEEIKEDDKEKIIKANTTFSITKGTVDELQKYGKVEEVMDAVKPVISLKNIEIIKA